MSNQKAWIGGGLIVSVLLAAPARPDATTLSFGVDYVRGDYGDEEVTRTLSWPLAIKHSAGAWTFKASVPYVSAEGTFSRELDATVAMHTQSGVGDLTLGVFRSLVLTSSGFGADLGGKAKIATDRRKTLITSGENDFAAQVDFFQGWVGVAFFASVGHLWKGDPAGIDYRNPWYGTLGANFRLAGGHSMGFARDYRQRLTPRGDPIREATYFYNHRINASDKVQVYVLRGYADASPDSGGGMLFSRTY